jgi:1-pyrroline-5-carboxylate dehydrogenase
MEKITYSSLTQLGEDFHRAFEAALSHQQKRFGQAHPLFINGHAVNSTSGHFPDVAPSDTRLVLGKFQSGTREHTRKAIAAAKTALSVWNDLSWKDRLAFLRKAAELMRSHQYELAALICLEVGKNRVEAIAEVSESIDIILYYCQQMEVNNGFEKAMSASRKEKTKTILKPYGVWAVVSPFNFPLALATGMVTGALLGGNTVVFKPASDTPFAGLRLYELLHQAGLPVGVFNFITGTGAAVGVELLENPDVDGFVFTGSRAVGMEIYRRFANKDYPRPCIAEMGGKNAAIIMPSAKLEDAVEGVIRSAFGMSGQKCSACSRLYVHKQIYKQVLDGVVEKTRALKIGSPAERDTFLGPLINDQALARFQKAVAMGKREGNVIIGGHRLTKGDFGSGFFAEPTIVSEAPKTSKLFEEEFFAPLLAVTDVKSLDEAITLANSGGYGLTAGIFTENGQEQEEFFVRIEAGVAYCNRRSGATTGAWPGVQSFGGWKGSGSSGKNALGPYYLQQFMHEQSQTMMMPEVTGPTQAPQFDAFQRRGMDHTDAVSPHRRW